MADLVNVADGAVQDNTGDLLGVLQVGHHDLTHQSAGVVLLVGDDQNIALVAEVQGGVQGQVVAGAALHGIGGAHHHLGGGVAHQTNTRIHGAAAAHNISGIGSGDGLELLHDLGIGHLALQINSLAYGHK